MMRTITADQGWEALVGDLTPRLDDNIVESVRRIVSDVERDGDAAIRRYEAEFGAEIDSIRVRDEEVAGAYDMVPGDDLESIHEAKRRLEAFEAPVKDLFRNITLRHSGIHVEKRFAPLDSVGCYIPGGLARYPSSVVMSVSTARLAGIARIAVATPPRKDGTVDPLTLAAADICGATEVYRTGGAQAIAALSFGTESIQPVAKIVGPGGAYVAAAKHMISARTAIDMIAGPTELGIISDSSSDARLVALDLISQAEHGADSTCFVITDSKESADAINRALEERLTGIERRETVRESLETRGFIAVCRTRDEAIRLANLLAPEHLEIHSSDPGTMAEEIHTPGLVLIGADSPSSASDYLMGTNHILPTNGLGRARGPLSVLDFLKLEVSTSATRGDLEDLSEFAKRITRAEGLPNHLAAIEGRIR